MKKLLLVISMVLMLSACALETEPQIIYDEPCIAIDDVTFYASTITTTLGTKDVIMLPTEFEDIEINKQMGKNGSRFLEDGDVVLTHCNAGALATAGYGTALGVIRAAIEEGKKIEVYACETRPYLQGARLTAWEL